MNPFKKGETMIEKKQFNKWFVFMLSIIGFLVINQHVEALGENFKLRDFEGVWSLVGGAQGGLSGNQGLAVSQMGHMVINKKGKGLVYSVERVSWEGNFGTPLKVTDIEEPLKITIELTRPDIGKGIIHLESFTAVTGPSVKATYSFIVLKGDPNKVDKFYMHLTEVIPPVPGLVPNCLPIFTVERQIKKTQK